MNFANNTITVMRNRVYGYLFHYVDGTRREAFMARMKTAIPMKMWDGDSKRWWVPDIYSPIIESIALEFGALREEDRIPIAGSKAAYCGDSSGASIEADFALIGCIPNVPMRLAEMAMMYWRANLTNISISTLALQDKEDAWGRIQAHYISEAQRPLVGPLGTAR